MSPPEFILVWDLDDTLGSFHILADTRRWSEPTTVHIRPGIAAALTRLSAAGFTHTVLTLASPAYAELALRGTGLRHHFKEVAGVGQRHKGDVEGIASAFGMPLEECAHRMLFVGDHPLFDPPRSPDVVFHLETRALERPAGALADLVLVLLEQGAGSLRRGFDRLVGQGALETVLHGGQLTRVEHPGLDPLVLLSRDQSCPVIFFEDGTPLDGTGEPVTFVPAEIHPL